MPDAAGRFKPFAHNRKTTAAWERIFAPRPTTLPMSQECEACGVYGHCPTDQKETP
jgi:hypothetical protein